MPLADIAASMLFLQEAGYGHDAEVHAATLGAALLPSDRASALALAIASSSELVPDFQQSPPDYGLQLIMLAMRAKDRQAVVLGGLIFFLYHRAARSGDLNRVGQLRSWIDSLAPDGGNPEMVSVLKAQTQLLHIAESKPPGPRPILFSISIDLVGSTNAKTRVMGLARGNGRRIDEFNTRISRAFCEIEKDFYRYAAVGNYRSGAPVELERFFAVKGIGDEIWLLCEPSPELIAEQGARLIDAALEITSRSVDFLATENAQESPFEFSPSFDYGASERIRSPIKVYIDAVEHATDLGRMRDEQLLSAIPNILKDARGRQPSALELTDVMNRLCLGYSEGTTWGRIHLHRTDYIGHEIDRFFRSTKAASPGTVAVGGNMIRHLGLTFGEPISDIMLVYSGDGAVLRDSMYRDPIHAKRRSLSNLKGIGYPYEIYTMFAPRGLNGKYAEMRTQRKMNMPFADFRPTQRILPSRQVKETASHYYPKQDVGIS